MSSCKWEAAANFCDSVAAYVCGRVPGVPSFIEVNSEPIMNSSLMTVTKVAKNPFLMHGRMEIRNIKYYFSANDVIYSKKLPSIIQGSYWYNRPN